MERERSGVETGEVTRASRTVEIDGVSTVEGDVIGLHNGVLVVAGQNLTQVVLDLLGRMQAAERDVVDLYHGAEVTPAEAEALSAAVAAAYPKLDVTVHSGGQAHYYYILSLE
jgi:dihydroxyacetone kinase-like predicted kinase